MALWGEFWYREHPDFPRDKDHIPTRSISDGNLLDFRLDNESPAVNSAKILFTSGSSGKRLYPKEKSIKTGSAEYAFLIPLVPEFWEGRVANNKTIHCYDGDYPVAYFTVRELDIVAPTTRPLA